MPSEFKIGTANTLYDFLPLNELLDTSQGIDPDWSYQPFSASVRLANGILQGNGFPQAIWRWNAMDLANRQILRNLIGTNLSAAMYIRTATNEVDDVYEDIIYKAFSCIMNWPDEDEDIQADNTVGLVITFTHLVEVVE
jgi:hypothetical protein